MESFFRGVGLVVFVLGEVVGKVRGVVVGLSHETGYGGTIPVSPVVHVAGSEGGPRPILFTAIT